MKPEYRAASPKDVEWISACEAEIFPDPWKKEDILDLISKDGAMCFVATLMGKPVSYVLGRKIAPEGEIYRVATKNEYRKNGYAHLLLNFLFEREEKNGISELYLEVRESNTAARNLYTGCGFVEISIRKNYYKSPSENAVIMKKDGLLEKTKNEDTCI